MRLWRRHRCPPGVTLTIRINGETVIGPITSEDLAFLTRFASAGDDEIDLLSYDEGWACLRGEIRTVEARTTYWRPS